MLVPSAASELKGQIGVSHINIDHAALLFTCWLQSAGLESLRTTRFNITTYYWTHTHRLVTANADPVQVGLQVLIILILENGSHLDDQ